MKTFFFFWGGGSGRGGGEGVGGHRVDVNKVFVKIKKKNNWLGRVGVGGQGGCERRIEVFVKIQKKKLGVGEGGGGGGVGFGGSGWM